MFHYRQVLVRMRQGDSDREIARSRTMGRRKIAQVRERAAERGWLAPDVPLPDDATLAAAFERPQTLPAGCVSTLEPWRDLIAQWHAQGIQGTTLHAALARNQGYRGSVSSVYRFVNQLVLATPPEVPLRLSFKPGEAAQVDFGAGPTITHTLSGETRKTWFFVMTLCWSRHQYAEFVHDQSSATWLACHRRAFEWFGGVPGRLGKKGSDPLKMRHTAAGAPPDAGIPCGGEETGVGSLLYTGGGNRGGFFSAGTIRDRRALR